jgi:hypothetical protein
MEDPKVVDVIEDDTVEDTKGREGPSGNLLGCHYADCAVNNAPAYEAGHCTCGGFKVGR